MHGTVMHKAQIKPAFNDLGNDLSPILAYDLDGLYQVLFTRCRTMLDNTIFYTYRAK